KIKEFEKTIDQLSMLTEDIQYEVTEARMIPIGQVFNRFPRMVRDIAKKEKKKVDFSIEGSNIKLDRTILDKIGEPLIHLLRNAVDHGIETPEGRRKSGKDETGKIKLSARREKNSVIIEVTDDGAGFNPNRIREVAIKKGIINEKEAKSMSRKEIFELPFLPTFSTSEKVTDISGRGVGLDVVKTRIEEMSGSIKMENQTGKGTRFILELPLTLAIIKCLLVCAGENKYAIPLINISRIVKVKSDGIKHMEGNEIFILDQEDIPLFRLRELFNIPLDRRGDIITVIVERSDGKVGLGVDRIVGEQELIIKPVAKALKKIKGIAGATILGDGQPALVLDVATLI
ncbi:MAG TPA: chemotaxis protein CheA, partial [Candidatus Altiarchaeales archaeon]|nr:chemotaxis protein CheA [Candidatus Altiarchaeales archaeon]